MNENQNTSKLYRLEEMLDSIEASLDNIKTVKTQQEHLLKLVEDNDEKHEFEEFLKESKEQLEKLSKQFIELSTRYTFLKAVVEKCKNDKKVEEIIDQLILGIGMFK